MIKGEVLFKVNVKFEGKLTKAEKLLYQYIVENFKDTILINSNTEESLYESIKGTHTFTTLITKGVWGLKNKGALIEISRKFKSNRDKHKVLENLNDKDLGRFNWAKSRYNLEYSEYAALKEKQNDTCAICNNPQVDRELAIDHCHKTNVVRGLLCIKCNTGIGRFKDNVELLQNAIKYIQKWENGKPSTELTKEN